MDWTEEDLTEVVPTDCEAELCEMLREYSIQIHRGKDKETDFEYLEESDVVITVQNPFPFGKTMEIELTGEFTLFFGGYHQHYWPYVSDFKMLKDDILQFLANECCAGVLYYWSDTERNWLGSSCFRKEELAQPIETLFSFVLQEKEFRRKLDRLGGAVRFEFWNPEDNQEILIERKPQP